MFKHFLENLQMKKLAFFLALGILASCTYRDNTINFMPFRNQVFTFWQTEKIFYYDQSLNEEFLSESQTITENKVERGQVLITHTGEQMASTKTYRTDYYSTETVKPNKNGEMDSAYSPLKIKKNGKYNAFGEVTYDGQTYMLVSPEYSKDILLVEPDGTIYNHIGRMMGKRLIVLSAEFFITPRDLKMYPVVDTRIENSDNAEGYTLTYDGLENDGNEMVFTYHKLGEEPQQVRFSICDEQIEIFGLEIDVFDASEEKIEYMIK